MKIRAGMRRDANQKEAIAAIRCVSSGFVFSYLRSECAAFDAIYIQGEGAQEPERWDWKELNLRKICAWVIVFVVVNYVFDVLVDALAMLLHGDVIWRLLGVVGCLTSIVILYLHLTRGSTIRTRTTDTRSCMAIRFCFLSSWHELTDE